MKTVQVLLIMWTTLDCTEKHNHAPLSLKQEIVIALDYTEKHYTEKHYTEKHSEATLSLKQQIVEK